MKTKETFMRETLRILFLAGIVSFLAPHARAEGVLSIAPGSSVVVEQMEFTVEVAISDSILSLMGYDVRVTFDPAYLEVRDVTEGSLPAGSGYATFFRWLNPACSCDSIHVNGAILGHTVDGPGVLINLRFKALAVGTTCIGLSAAGDLRDGGNSGLLFSATRGTVKIDKKIDIDRRSWGDIKSLFIKR